jgi:hypothetical protein
VERRSGYFIAGFVLLAACSSGGGRSSRPTTQSPATNTTTSTIGVSLRRFSGNLGTLRFSHPRAWREQYYAWDSSFIDVIVYLSNRTLRNPCTTRTDSAGVTTSCGRPLAALRPGDVLVTWQNVGYPHTGPEIPHPNTTISGQSADVEVARPGDSQCAGLGQDETMTADIARPQGNHYEMVACLRGPNLSRNEAFVRQMLVSTRVTG